jgi:hypothetical protein
MTAAGTASGAAAAKIRRVLPKRLVWSSTPYFGSLARHRPARRVPGPESTAPTARSCSARRRGAPSPAGLDQVHRRRRKAARTDPAPYGLVSHAGRWYVTGVDRNRPGRTFRLDHRSADPCPAVPAARGLDPAQRVLGARPGSAPAPGDRGSGRRPGGSGPGWPARATIEEASADSIRRLRAGPRRPAGGAARLPAVLASLDRPFKAAGWSRPRHRARRAARASARGDDSATDHRLNAAVRIA